MGDGTATAIATRVSETNVSENRHPTPLAGDWLADAAGHLGGVTAAHQKLVEVANRRDDFCGGSIVLSRCSRLFCSDNEIGGD
jgi:hypothetical protein